MSTVTVLCPNARRQQVKVQPNTKFLEIIEEVCKKQGYDPNEYELIHLKKSLDVSMTYRLSGLANNAHLDLRKLENGPRKFQDVTIVLQLEDGTRLQPKTFKPDTTSLASLIESYKDSSELLQIALDESLAIQTENYPTISYLNESAIGLFQLKNTTLKDFGLTNGRAIIRFVYRNIDREQLDKLNLDFEQKLEKKLKLEEAFRKQKEKEEESQMDAKSNEQQQAAFSPMSAHSLSSNPSLSDLTSTLIANESETNLVKRQKLEEMELDATTTATTSAASPMTSQMQYELNDATELPKVRPSFSTTSTNQFANFKFPQAGGSSQEADVIIDEESSTTNRYQNNEFANFKFPEETKGQKLNDFSDLMEIEKLSKQACDRQAILFNLDQNKPTSQQDSSASNSSAASNYDANSSDLPDDFFDITVNDLRYMLSDLKRAQSEETPLMTKKMRELIDERKAMKYSQIVIRVCFKNRISLQGLFRPKEPISALYDFVKENLSDTNENSVDDLDFYLYTTPPKVILSDRKKNLYDAKLCPASLVYFKNKNDTVPKFKSNLNLRTIEQANEIVKVNVHQTMREIDNEHINWLQSDDAKVQNIMKSAIPTTTSASSSNFNLSNRAHSSSSSSTNANPSNDETKAKLNRFLKGSKK